MRNTITATTLDKLTPMALICSRRGWDEGFIASLIEPDTGILDGMDAAVSMLRQHIEAGRTITVLTDFDMDGISAGLLAYGGLAELGANVELVIPDYKGGYGITTADIDEALMLYPDTSLFITCDVGITCNEAIAHARARGVETLVTDHHMENPDDPCIAPVALNPNRVGSNYPNPHICGAQVAAMLLREYAHNHRPDKIADIAMLDVFAGIGALADVMPLRGGTRLLVRKALALLSMACPEIPTTPWGSWDPELAGTARPETSLLMKILNLGDHDWRYTRLFFGLGVLLRNMVEARKLRSLDDVDASFIGFTLAPTFNATRRVKADMADSFNIFAPQAVQAHRPGFTTTPDESAKTILANNERRKTMLAEALEAMLAADQPLAPFAYYSDAPAGILGLLAGRMSEAHGAPAMVLHPDALSGSARAPEWFDVLGAAADNEGVSAAGHRQACGVRAESTEALENFVADIARRVSEMPVTDDADRPDLHIADIYSLSGIPRDDKTLLLKSVDGPVPPVTVVSDLINQLDALEPFGHGLEYPDIRVSAMAGECSVRQLSGGKHLKITLPCGMDLLWWNQGGRIEEVKAAGLITARVRLGVNTFRNKTNSQGIVDKLHLGELEAC